MACVVVTVALLGAGCGADRVTDPATLATWDEYDAHHRDAFVERITAFVERVGS